jgi:hypothetical protein
VLQCFVMRTTETRTDEVWQCVRTGRLVMLMSNKGLNPT